ncbi:MAG: 4-hydroxythreonine-4-phosphate dehydrogenase PdxA [Bacteroidales bacterium]|nr:4-hydroxythreonine-4-phosphate dehydrogenase PdxA [Bacteroidales bacterium]
MDEHRIRVGITQGDINGIGYEVIIKALTDPRILEICTPVVYGSPKVMAYHRKALNIPNFSLNSVANAKEANPRRANLINCLDDNARVELGKPSGYAGEAAFISLEMAVNDLLEHQIDLLVTAPINKNTIQSKDFNFTGHTEYLQEKLGSGDVLMLMVSEYLKVGVVTTHIPISQVAASITTEAVISKIRLLDHSLRTDFNIGTPRIAVLGLNPHSGDQGLLGSEEEEIIKPAIEIARKENIMALGPYAADGYFGSGLYQKFDAVLAMYHDQGLAPFKALSFDSGVNFTAGLPYVRTSPAHGTAYEIAGLDKASPDSMRQAIYMAVDIYKARKANRELKKNALGAQ